TGLSKKEMAQVGEHLDELEGINTTTTSVRDYPKKRPFFAGSVKNIPEEDLSYYLSRGYERDSSVGVSGLEKEYEDVLSGQKDNFFYTTKENGDILDKEEIEGSRGYDLELTMNMDFQHKVEKLTKKYAKKNYKGNHKKYKNTVYTAVMNPQTGGILALVGWKYNDDKHKFELVNSRTMQAANLIGSSAKGATILAGYETDTLPGTMVDKPIYNTKQVKENLTSNCSKSMIHSYIACGLGSVNKVTALEKSSNVY